MDWGLGSILESQPYEGLDHCSRFHLAGRAVKGHDCHRNSLAVTWGFNRQSIPLSKHRFRMQLYYHLHLQIPEI